MGSLAVFGWHNVESTWCFPSPGRTGPDGFVRQLQFLARWANVVPLQEGLDRLIAGERLPPHSVALTFDDGYRDNLEVAVPLLEGLGLPATFFLVPELLDGSVPAWWERLAWAFACTTRTAARWEDQSLNLSDNKARRSSGVNIGERLKRRDRRARELAVEELVQILQPSPRDELRLFLTWPEAAQISRRGFALGSHSSHHAILSSESDDDQRQDLTAARHRLAGAFDLPMDVVAYPNGGSNDYTPATIEAARSAGHLYAVTTVNGLNRRQTPPYEIRRYVMYPEQGAVGFLKLAKHGLSNWWLARSGLGWRR